MTEKTRTGYRQGLRDRFLSENAESYSEEELLELLLTFAIESKEVKLIAEDLIRVYGSLSRVLTASHDDLSKVKGLGQSAVALLKLIGYIATRDIGSVVPKKSPAKLAAQGACEKPYQKLSPSNPPNNKAISQKASTRRKFQVSNGYLLAFDQLARILHFLMKNRQMKRINRKALQEDTGLADRQVESLVSMGAAMGLIKPVTQVLTPAGLLVAEHDMFIEKTGSLEWCHYAGAGSFRNLVWFEVFNHLLTQTPSMTQKQWTEKLRNGLAGKYSKGTITKNLNGEVYFIIDAYTQRNFNKLELLHRSSDDSLYRRRYTRFSPLVLSAMIYDFCAAADTHLFQVDEMAMAPGSPAAVFGLDAASFRQQMEGLHDRGWLRYETTHNLDQIRLKTELSAIHFLTAYYEGSEPREGIKSSPGGMFQ